MPHFRKKPVVVEAEQFDGDIPGILRDERGEVAVDGVRLAIPGRGGGWPYLVIPTLEGDMRANLGDWIIKGVKGEFYPCKDDIFRATYDAVEA